VFRHIACGTLLDDAAACPACGLTPAVEDVVSEPRPGRARVRDDPVAIVMDGPHRMLAPIESA
jgi:hypothetical protein